MSIIDEDLRYPYVYLTVLMASEGDDLKRGS